MAALLKDLYTRKFFETFASIAMTIIPGFTLNKFLARIYSKEWEQKELKQRMKHIAVVLHSFMDDEYPGNLRMLLKLIREIERKAFMAHGIELMFLTEFIELYGIDYYKESMEGMEEVTKFISCEFAIRPFLIRYPEKSMKQMLKWSKHTDHRVRRLATEGSRPRLPWAMAVSGLKKDPSPILPILENLKNDTSESVRRSVANNLNDISRDHPERVLEILYRWKNQSPETDRIVRHASRTLLRKGVVKALSLFELNSNINCEINDLVTVPKSLKMGDSMSFSFTLVHHQPKTERLRLDFAIDYVKANNKRSRKIFRVNEAAYDPSKTYHFKKKLSFKDLTTRKHYPGKHQLSILVNGKEKATLHFLLK